MRPNLKSPVAKSKKNCAVLKIEFYPDDGYIFLRGRLFLKYKMPDGREIMLQFENVRIPCPAQAFKEFSAQELYRVLQLVMLQTWDAGIGLTTADSDLQRSIRYLSLVLTENFMNGKPITERDISYSYSV